MPMFKRSMVILLGILAMAAGFGWYSLAGNSSVALDETPVSASGADPSQKVKLAVYVSGAVHNPGVVYVPQGSRVSEAVAAAGGVLPTADSGAINLAQPVKDGQQVNVPEKNVVAGNGKSARGDGKIATDPGEKININQADATELEKLPGIGKSMAQRIVDYRNANGSFQSIDDLKKVKGIGKSKLAKFADKITI